MAPGRNVICVGFAERHGDDCTPVQIVRRPDRGRVMDDDGGQLKRGIREVQDVLQPPRAGANSAAAPSTATPRIAGPTQNSKGVITEAAEVFSLASCVIREANRK